MYMAKEILVKTAGKDSYYRLIEENQEKANEQCITVEIPYTNYDGDFPVIDKETVTIKDQKKIVFIKEFFAEEQIALVRNGLAYVIDEIIFDEVPLPY
jgi:hypothetical protein